MKITSKLFTRLSAIFIFIHLLGHTGGHMGWDDETGPLYHVVKVMKSNSAEFMGATKTMADYFNGYSIMLFGVFGMSILILWNVSNHLQTNKQLAKPILVSMGIAYLFFGIVEYIYFFPFAAFISFFAGLFALLAVFKLNNDTVNN